MNKVKKLRIDSDFVAGHKKGDVVPVHVDANNVPLERFWRKQLKNAKRDKCCVFLETKKPKRSSD